MVLIFESYIDEEFERIKSVSHTRWPKQHQLLFEILHSQARNRWGTDQTQRENQFASGHSWWNRHEWWWLAIKISFWSLLPTTSKYHICYPAHYVRTLVQKDIDRAKEDEKKSQKERDDVDKRLKKLKAVLYGKFGNSINL